MSETARKEKTMVRTEREYRSFKNIETREQEDGFLVEGYATTFDEPYVMWEDEGIQYKEQISRNAIEGADMSDVLFLYNHEGMVYARQKNGSLELEADEKGLRIRANLGLTAAARELYEAIKAGLIDQMSWAFSVKADEYDRETHTRTITSIKKCYDVSAVSIPANPATSISARDYFNGVIEAEKRRDLNLAKAKAKFKLRSIEK